MTSFNVRLTAALLGALAMLITGTALAQQGPKRAISKIAGDLYRF